MFLLYIFSVYLLLVGSEGNNQLLHSVKGEVAGGNFTYYSLLYKGPVSLVLHSRYGDADLYVSQDLVKPTYEPDSYCLQSTTCGLDIVHIPSSFRRPIGVGIYGHPSYEESEYLLEAIYLEEEIDHFFVNDNEFGDKIDRDNLDGPLGKDDSKEGDSSFLGAFLWAVINILVEVLFI